MPQRYRHESTGLLREKKGIMSRSALDTMETPLTTDSLGPSC